jgi:hypothetical protein
LSICVTLFARRKTTNVKRNTEAYSHDHFYHGNTQSFFRYIVEIHISLSILRNLRSILIPVQISLPITRSTIGASYNVPDIVARNKQILDSHNRYRYKISRNPSITSPTVYEDRWTRPRLKLRISTKRAYIKNGSLQHFTCDIINNRFYYLQLLSAEFYFLQCTFCLQYFHTFSKRRR